MHPVLTELENDSFSVLLPLTEHDYMKSMRQAFDSVSEVITVSDLTLPDVVARPRICCIDLTPEVVEMLKKAGMNVTTGTLGTKVKVPNKRMHEQHRVLSSHDFPANIHEYDIVIIDLNNHSTIDFQASDHTRDGHTGATETFLVCTYPETVFDPRPLGSVLLKHQIDSITNRPVLVLAFTSPKYDVVYKTNQLFQGYVKDGNPESYNIYSFWDEIYLSSSKSGSEINVGDLTPELRSLFSKFLAGTEYNQTFVIPKKWIEGESVPDPSFIPLLTNSNDNIVSLYEAQNNKHLFLFPQIKDKGNFLIEFLTKHAPGLFPSIFPFSTTFQWKNEADYWLPNHKTLIERKDALVAEYEQKLIEADQRIAENSNKYSFLLDMVSETGDNLRDAIILFLQWLEFDGVHAFDVTKAAGEVLEEDIQVVMPHGLLVIECKGIGGTSTDSECSQISKIKHRRCEERNRFDVYALYIVNHQRYLPPLKRKNPPFSEHQIKDAGYDKRGLVSTWQLFNLYDDIENGILTKQDAREALLEYGLISFRPKNLSRVGTVTEVLKDGFVAIITIQGMLLRVNDEVLIERDETFTRFFIQGLQINGQKVDEATDGEIGIRLSGKIKTKSTIWKR